MIHAAKRSWIWPFIVAAALLFSLAVCWLLAIFVPDLLWVATPVAVGGLSLLWLLTPVRYVVTPQSLNLQMGVCTLARIPISAIEEVSPKQDSLFFVNPLARLVTSLRTLRVRYRSWGGTVCGLISPQNPQALLEDLAHADPKLKIFRNRVIRT